MVQERDRIGRVTPSGRWVWKSELRSPVEDLAIGPEGFAAATNNDGQIMVFDPSGEPTIQTLFDPSDPPLLIEAPDGSPIGVVWLSLARVGCSSSAVTTCAVRSSGESRFPGRAGPWCG